MVMFNAATERLRRRQGQGGASTAIVCTGHGLKRGEAGVQTQLALSFPFLAPLITGLGPFEAMAMSFAAEKRLRCRCRQGRGGASIMISPLSLLCICKHSKTGCKSKSILQRSN